MKLKIVVQMLKAASKKQFNLRNLSEKDVPEVYRLLVANRPYVGLNSRYTYFLLAKDFSETCFVAEHENKVVAFSSGYVPPQRKDTFFNWEIVVQKEYRGNGLQKLLLLHQIKMADAKYFEGTINPSNDVSRKNYIQLSELLNAKYEEKIFLTVEDFENDGHETEILFRIGPMEKNFH